MGRRPPILSLADVRTILGRAGFVLKRTKSSHEHWEGYVNGKREMVTVDTGVGEFAPNNWLTSSMIRQSGLAKKTFYGHLDAPAKPKPKAKASKKSDEKSDDSD